jgi:hypothetical protein
VAVARVDVRTERLEIERELSGSVRAVHDRERPGRARRRADLLDREHERGRRRDVRTETRVRIEMFSVSSSGSTSTTFARMKPSVRRIAPYSCFVVRISSSGRTRSERITAFSAEVAFGVKTRSLGAAPTNAARDARASHIATSNRRTKKCVGSVSSSRWSRWYSSNTSTGQAP